MNYQNIFRNCVTFFVLTLSSFTFSQAVESLLLPPLKWRCIGPKRGGRSIAVAGHKDHPFEYYFGATGGGLWKTTDGGATWYPVTDGQIRSSSVGAVAVAESNPDIVYLGMGEAQLRQNVLQGDGVYKSTDGGRTFVRIPDTHSDHHDLWIDPNNPSRMINGNDGGHLRNPRGPSGEWMYAVGGGENGHIAPHPIKTDIFYAGATNTLTRYVRKTGLSRDIQPYPRIVMGEPAQAMPERWNWNYPIILSPVDPDVLFVGSQHLWRTSDEGKTWEKISPDLTRADPETMVDSGGPIIFDQDGPEIYATIYAISPSRHDVNTIWTGSDDGLVYLTRDGGKTWKIVTPSDLLKDSKVTMIESSPHNPGTAYVTARRYEMDDRAPYVWKTKDYGLTWIKITNGIREDDFAHAICEDPNRDGLLYLGTEHGVYISFDDGINWQSLSLNLPDIPVMGIAVKQNDLIIATHGRSFWVLDDIETLRQIDSNVQDSDFHLFQPADAIRRSVLAVVDYYVKGPGRKVLVEILDAEDQHVLTLHEGTTESGGVHRHSWDLRYPGAVAFPGIVLEGGNPKHGPWAFPGRYQARLVVDGGEQIQGFNVKKDPRLTDVTDADLKAQFDLALKIRDKESAANEGVILIRNLKAQVEDRLSQTDGQKLRNTAKKFVERISSVEQELYQVKNQSPKDKIAFPIKLNDRLTGLRSHLERGDGLPTKGYYQVFEELSAKLTVQLQELERILRENMPHLNKELERLGLSRIIANEKGEE